MSEELDFEAEISSVFNVEPLNITEVDAPNRDALQLDPGEAEDGPTETPSNDKEVLNDAGKIQSICEEVEDDNMEIQSENEDIESNTINIIQLNTEESHSDAGEIQSDTGEVENDNNLEDGEIEDNAPIPSKDPETNVCHFFKRGSCLYGSECRNLHVSNEVYNMFEPVLSNKSNVHIPAVFHPAPILIMMPNIESPWERGIKQAKIVMENANFRKSNPDDIENDWQRCLEMSKQRIQQKTYLKRQSYDSVKPNFGSNYYDQGKFREREPENKILKTNHPKIPHFSYSKYTKESNCEKKTKSDVNQTPNHLKWVDPWQRSKSPRKRSKSSSLSPSHSMKRSRKGSISSSSSSSSSFKRIYESKQSKSPKKFRSASRSSSVFSRSKKSSTFNKRSHSRGRSYSRSPRRSYSKSSRRSYSKSSRRSCCSGSCSSSRSSSASSEDLYAQKKSDVKKIPTDKLVSKNEKRSIPAEKSKEIYQSSFKYSLNKTSGRTSSPCHSDKSVSSDLSMSSLSYTSISSNGKGTLKTNVEGKAFSRSKVDKVPQDRSRDAPTLGQGYQKSEALKKLSKVSDQKKLLSPDRKKLLMYKDTSTKTNCVETPASKMSSLNKPVSLVSKPPITKNVPKQKPSKATLELLKYHSFGRKNNSASVSTPAAQPSVSTPAGQPKAILPTLAKAVTLTTAFKIPNCQIKASEEALPKIASNMQPKPQKPINIKPDVTLKTKQNATVRRDVLLLQLKAIEEAIARKKQLCNDS